MSGADRGIGHSREALDRATALVALVVPAYFSPLNIERARADIAVAEQRGIPILIVRRVGTEIPDGFFPERAVVIDYRDRFDLFVKFPRIEGELALAGIDPDPTLLALWQAARE